MITINENGRATVPGVGNLPIQNLTARELDMDTPPEQPHPIRNIGNILGLGGLDVRLNALLARDTAYSVPRRDRAYNSLLEMAVNDLGPAISKAKKIGSNTDLKDEIRAQRVAEAVAEPWPDVEKRVAEIQREADKAVDLAEAIYRAAWTLPDETDLNLQELRDREVRDILRGMDATQRLLAVMDAARSGRLDLFRQLEADPMGQLAEVFPSDSLKRAKALALDNAGLGWVQVMRDDAEADREHIAAVIQVFEDGIAAELKNTFAADLKTSTPSELRVLKAA